MLHTSTSPHGILPLIAEYPVKSQIRYIEQPSAGCRRVRPRGLWSGRRAGFVVNLEFWADVFWGSLTATRPPKNKESVFPTPCAGRALQWKSPEWRLSPPGHSDPDPIMHAMSHAKSGADLQCSKCFTEDRRQFDPYVMLHRHAIIPVAKWPLGSFSSMPRLVSVAFATLFLLK